MEKYTLDALDKKILRMIADNARIPFLEVARECNVSGAAIHQRIQKLTRIGVIKGTQFIFDPEKMEYRKVKDFKEFTHFIHTRYWFHDPSKGYHKDAPYKWDADVPRLDDL